MTAVLTSRPGPDADPDYADIFDELFEEDNKPTISDLLLDLEQIKQFHDASAVTQVMDDILHRVEERVASATCPPAPELSPVDYADDVHLVSKHHHHRKKSRRHRDEKKSRERKRKRSTSCSTVSSTCSSFSVKKHKKKKKHQRDEDPPNPRVNPIFLWVKQDDTKIVEVLCEDYDKRNRITLTKTAAGWRAIPRTERLSRQSSQQLVTNPFNDTKDPESEDDRAISCEMDSHSEVMEHNTDHDETSEDDHSNERLNRHRDNLSEIAEQDESCREDVEMAPSQPAEEPPKEEEAREGVVKESEDKPEGGHGSEEVPERRSADIDRPMDFEDPAGTESEEREREIPRETEKCCEMNSELSNVDENHNNEYEDGNEGSQIDGAILLSKYKDCSGSDVSQMYREVDECVEKGLKDLIDSLDEQCMNKDVVPNEHCGSGEASLDSETSVAARHKFLDAQSLSENCLEDDHCDELMEELEEMCHGMIDQRLKTEETRTKKEDLTDVYTFVPSPVDDPPKVTIQGYKSVCKESVVDLSHSKQVKKVEEACEPLYEEELNSPINLVIQHKEVKTNGPEPCEEHRTNESYDSTLDIVWRLPEGTTIHQAGRPILKREEAKPAHQQAKVKFDILNIPQPRVPNGVQEEPLDLGKSKVEKKPPALREIRPASCDTKPTVPKFEDITLKKILNKQNAHNKVNPKTELNIDAKTKSKLLELLTSETMEDKQAPLAQLKEVLSDPTLVVPDPLLVPRARLPALVANPAKEIPRLLAQNQERMTYPKVDPDLLEVSLAHLQSILQSTGKDENLARLYQRQAQMLQSQLKQDQGCLDAATANALNQMLWLPYLNQLEAAAAACGNNQDFLTMLNMVFPPYPYGQNPYVQQMPQGYDYNGLQQSQMLSAWQEMMQKPQLSGYNNEAQKKYDPYKMYLKPEKKASARTSPLPTKYQQQKHRNNSHVTSTNACNYESALRQQAHFRPKQNLKTESHYQRGRSDLDVSFQQQQLRSAELLKRFPQQREPEYGSRGAKQLSEMDCILRSAEYTKNSVSHASKEGADACTDPSKPQVPKLKVKEHLVDPNLRPKLLKFDDHHMAPHAGHHFTDEAHPHLWHPLFSSHQGKSYTSPWQWTTPVTVSGE